MNDKLDILKSREIPPSAIRGKDGKFYFVEQGCGVVRNASGKVLSIEAGRLDAHRRARREHRREH